MPERVARMQRRAMAFLERLGRAHLFGLSLIGMLGAALRRPGATLGQVAGILGRSAPSMALAGLLVGMGLALHADQGLGPYTAGQGAGELVALALVHGLGPVVAALLFAARAGSQWSAEIGRMRAGEQLAALEVMGIDPGRRVLAPRFLAAIVAMPLLTALFCALGLAGAYLVEVELLGAAPAEFQARVRAVLLGGDGVARALLESVVFGAVVAWIALFQGYDGPGTPAGPARVTTRAVVHAVLAVLALDVLLAGLLAAG